MEKFKLPRLEKKKLKKGLWLYPPDEKSNSLMASPHRIKKDYDAMKGGVLKNVLDDIKEREIRERFDKLDQEIYISDDELRACIKDIFRKDYQQTPFDILKEAKNHKTAKKAYFNFVNAYYEYKDDASFGNTCCMSVDLARHLLKSSKPRQKKKKRHNS